MGGSPQAAAMRFNDRAADPKSHACAVSFGGKERIEDLVPVLRGKSHAGIAHGHKGLLVFSPLRLDDQLARPLHIPHRIDAIDHQVHQHLLQLHAVSHHLGKIFGQLRPNGDEVSRRLASQENGHLSNDFVQINQLPLRSTLFEKQTDSANDFRGTRCVFDDPRGSVAGPFQIGMIARKPAQTGIGVGDRGGNRLVHFVRQRGRPG